MVRKLFVCCLVCAFLAATAAAASLPASAAATVELKVLPGMGGLYKVDQPLELTVAVENPGPALDGVIRVRLDEERQDRPHETIRFLMNVSVPSGSSGLYRLVIPGDLAASMPIVELVSGDTVLAGVRVEGAAVGGGQVILTLSEDIAGSGLQEWLSKNSDTQTSLKYLSPGELPGEALPLSLADVIMIDELNSSSLTGEQAGAIKEWLFTGGTLVLFGGAGSGAGGLFSELTPVLATGTTIVEGNLGGLRSGGPLRVASGELVAGRALAMDSGQTVLARRELGRGVVFFCGAAPRDLGGEALGVWSSIFGSPTGYGSGFKQVRRGAVDGMLVSASSYITRMAGPNVLVLAGLWLVYLMAVGPLLYLLLRRADRRDLAWALVPAGALTAALGFYFMAPSGRLQDSLSQTLATIEIFTPDLAEIRAGTSIVSSRGGELALRVPNSVYAVPAGGQGGLQNRPAVVCLEDAGSSVTYSGVEYGSLRQAYLYGLHREYGSIEEKLYLEGDLVKGELVNGTGFDLRDCKLLLGGRLISLGNLPAGGSARVEEVLEKGRYPAGRERLLMEIGGRNEPGEPFFLERQMLSQFSNDNRMENSIQFLGWHDGAPDIFKDTEKGGAREEGGLTMVKQSLSLHLPEGHFLLPAGFLVPASPGDYGVQVYPKYYEKRMAVSGQVELCYDLDKTGIKNSYDVEALYLEPVSYPYTAEIYNRLRDTWEPLPGEVRKITEEELQQYLGRDHKIVIRLMGEGREPYPVWPGLAVEGVAYE